MIAIRDERVEGVFDLDDIDLFRQLASQAARAVEASQVYERVKERDRLAAIGEMAAGLAHEIRNPLGAIKGAAQLLVGPDGKPLDLADSGDFLHIIVEEVDRLNNVVTQFLDYARVERSEPASKNDLDLNGVVQKTVQLLEKDEGADKVTNNLEGPGLSEFDKASSTGLMKPAAKHGKPKQFSLISHFQN
jgi:signal transduction histidine kinase